MFVNSRFITSLDGGHGSYPMPAFADRTAFFPIAGNTIAALFIRYR